MAPRRTFAVLWLSLVLVGACVAPGPGVMSSVPTGAEGVAAPTASVSAGAALPVVETHPAPEKESPSPYAHCVAGPETTVLRGRAVFPDDTAPAVFSASVSRERAGWRTSEDCDNQYIEFAASGGPAGGFAFEGLPSGVYQLTISGAGFVDRSLDPFVLAAGEAGDVGKVVLDRGRKLVGRVLGVDGAPAAGVKVQAADTLFGDERRFFSFRSPAPATTGPDGTFTITALGRGAIVAVADDPAAGRSLAVRLAAGDVDLAGELRLLRTGVITGTVTHDGNPTAADVTARPVGLGRAVVLTAMTGKDGRYRFERLAEGEYVVTAQMNVGDVHGLAFPAKAARVKVAAGAEGRLDLAIPEGRRLVIRAKLAKGKADLVTATLVKGAFSAGTDADIERALDGLDLEQARQDHTHLSEAAVIELLDVPPGGYTLCGVATSYTDTRAEVAARPASCSAVRVNAGRAQQEVELAVAGR